MSWKEDRPPSRDGWDVAALILLLVGGIVFPIVGWIVGVVILWTSPTWTGREKAIGTFVVPGGLASLFVMAFFAQSYGTCEGEKACVYSGGIKQPYLTLLGVALALASIGSIIYLWRRMERVKRAT